ncbi:hybrid sensor histidine kinase/response regulator [Taklimakanibacter deserti]|uniref:hybrid sensor histidine kinase/response regulator n=1 Tax=Taklimakanibacter deserti TaxID=2267839 RepID=UPI000E64D32D
MFYSWTVLFAGLAYVGALFAVASFGDRKARGRLPGTPRPLIYALSLGVYCTSWTYFGSVGVASRSGLDFLPIYIGPILVFAVGWRLLQTIVDIAKRQNITSIADFIAARYGKNEMLGALVALIAAVGIIPYISIQLKAVSFALETMMTTPGWSTAGAEPLPISEDIAFFVTVAMAAFAMLFGTRHIDTTEHQHGLMTAIAVESIVKLLAFVAVGLFITFAMMGGPQALIDQAHQAPEIAGLFSKGFAGGSWLTQTLLAMIAIMLLPRQFHVTVVENANAGDIKRARWLFPLYLVAINIFVVPIAIAGLVMFKPGFTDGDTFVLALPVTAGSQVFALIAFLGGLSAATAMVIVEAVALSIMVCNNLVMPIILRRRMERAQIHHDMGRVLITIRRIAIVVILLLAYSYYRMIGSSAALAQIGLISFAAVAQFAPVFFGGLLWKRGTAQGAMAGITVGFALWAYTLFLPSFADAGWIDSRLITEGPFGIGLFRPRMLFNLGFDPLTHGVIWSLLANSVVYFAVSLIRPPSPIERMQAATFITRDIPLGTAPGFRLWRTTVTAGEVEATVARYLGAERTSRAFAEAAQERKVAHDPKAEADIRMLRFAEHLLASAVGTASSRLVMGLLLERHSKNPRGAMKLLDDASAAIQYNRDLLQSAIDNVGQGIAVFDSEGKLICWNERFCGLLALPADMSRVGTPLEEVLDTMLRSGDIEARRLSETRRDRLRKITSTHEPIIEDLSKRDIVLELHSSKMPEDGGYVVTFTDITQSVKAAQELKRANETLEKRVEERTAELTRLNSELQRAKAEADAANLGKTKFIAAASHDILQPLNAARLFTASLVERKARGTDGELVRNVDASLGAVEDILSALLDISRLDAGALRPEISVFRIDELLNALKREFAPAAAERGLSFTVVTSSLAVRSDPKLLRRVLQNLVSNAIKYTRNGHVLMGCRRRGDSLRIEVHDSGPGIAEHNQAVIFQEFERLSQDKGVEPGLGLGLSIVERIARMMKHPLRLTSRPGRGSCFALTIPTAPASELAASRPKAASRRANRIGGLTIFVIDNEPQILEAMQALLGGWDARVVTARSGAEALALFATEAADIDVILADYHLHRDDGLDLIERLRAMAGRPVPAILITADRSRLVQDRAAERSVQYLRKPVRPAALRAALAQFAAQVQAAE